MKYNKLLCLALVFTILLGCAPFQTTYKEDEKTSNWDYPTQKEKDKSFFLIGDAGYSQPGGTSLGLLAFKTFLDSVKSKDNYAVFLGDNIYPAGMPPKGDKLRSQSEYRLDAQLDAVENFDGKVIFLPGNHDWYNEGLEGLERQEKYFEERLKDKKVFHPTDGCAFESFEIGDNIQLLVLDSQWYLEDWDKHPTINDKCPQLKSREAVLLEIEGELKKNNDKTIIFALHHPLYTNGVHGGQYAPVKHLYPSQKKIPLPILGSLAMQIRTSGGVSKQDRQNDKYKGLVKRLATLAQDNDRVIFASGHEHSLQYIINENIKQIVSGSGSKASYAVLSNDGLFSHPGQGFVVLDVFKDGSSWASFYGSEKGKPVLLYQKEVHEAPKDFDVSTLPDTFNPVTKASVYRSEDTDRSDTYESIWGDRYRDVYGANIDVQTVNLDTLYGGMTVDRKGGGHQTRSLRLKTKDGRDFNMRALRKSAVQFLQTTAFKNSYIEEDFKNTIAEDILYDFYTAAHPYGFMAIPTLSDAIGLYHTNPKLFYVPKQKALGKYNNEYGDEIYMIVERPEENHADVESFGKPNDIESTADVYERLRRDEKYKIDEPAYIKARIFDMLVGDWDRHQDQWRWSEFEKEDGTHVFQPIPRDRDQVFSNFDGAFFSTLRGLIGFTNQFAEYGENVDNVKWFNSAAVGLDRSLIQNKGKEEWLAQARYIKENITDEVIEEAFSKMPVEAQELTKESLVKKMKGRRDNIVNITERYYNYVSQLAIITATDKDDYIDITRLEDGKTRVKITRNKDGERADVVSDKTYSKDETKELWIYGLDDDDVFTVTGDGNRPIFTRIIGGQNNDIYDIQEGKRIKVYDYKSKPNTVKEKGGANFSFSDNYEVNNYNKDKKIVRQNVLLPGFGFNPDDGFRLGLQNIYTINSFRRNPFTQQHTISGGFYFATSGFDVKYTGEFANVLGNFNLFVGGEFTSENFSENFFGFGNETVNNDDDLSMDYNRVKIGKLIGKVGAIKRGDFGSTLKYTASIEGIEIEDTANRFVTDQFIPAGASFYDREFFLGAEAMFRYESYDNTLNPTRGMKFELSGGGKYSLEDENAYAYIKPYLGFFNALTNNRKLVLKTKAQGQVNLGDEFEFYQAAHSGGNTGNRAYRTQRFSGESALTFGGDLRYSFDQFKTSFLPFQIGIFTGIDTGRVWFDGEDSDKWHSSYGGGFWVNSADAINGTFNLFTGEDGLRFSFGFGFKF
ncbi:metallophosphoesterase [Croceibacter atlanticus]|uniref:metallophosphoesterase n=1 Tax=Croceibacter atlanticus TaxID=313588 RepID=UPI0023534FB6|nr:metallophosphoesterase [Croceibacter atlanticus]|tara:strand:+ start:44545 stop:48258 length:3714 start_codon:yes stop_codon:yes gene_type:complete